VNETNYSIQEHTHRYACWTAARAASIGRFSNEEVSNYFRKIKIEEKVNILRLNETLDFNQYEIWFRAIAKELLGLLTQQEKYKGNGERIKRNVSFGIAAKMISIYIKTVEVIPTQGTTLLSQVAFPPIDSILLNRIPDEWGIDKGIRWSKLEVDAYMQLIKDLRAKHQEPAFWKLEVYWTNE